MYLNLLWRVKMKKFLILSLFALLLNADSSYYEKGKLVELQKMNTLRSADGGSVEYFQTTKGQKIGIKDEILVQCKTGVDCKLLLNQFNLNDISKVTDTIFVVKIKDYDNIFLISRELFESAKVNFAHPNFVKERRLR